uniref:Uncharacterized protein n=1 Tax=Acrobeloides nanus TaxID=290746 RepID=A0A914DSV4_9BILA
MFNINNEALVQMNFHERNMVTTTPILEVKLLRDKITDYFNDCFSWGFSNWNITIMTENGEIFNTKNLDDAIHNLYASHFYDEENEKLANTSTSLKENFFNFFHSEVDANDTLNIAFIFNDIFYGWEYSEFLIFLANNQEILGDFIYQHQIFTKFFTISPYALERENNSMLVQIYERTENYFEGIQLFSEHVEYYFKKSFSTCNELKTNTYYHCTQRDVSSRENSCNAASINIYMLLNEYTSNDEFSEIKEVIKKLLENCPRKLKLAIFHLSATDWIDSPYLCYEYSVCLQMISNLTLDKFLYSHYKAAQNHYKIYFV